VAPNLNRATIALRFHEEHGLPLPTCAQLVEGIIEHMLTALERGEQVSIVRFGTFRPYLGAAKLGRDLRTLEPIIAPPQIRVKFIPSDAFRDAVSRIEHSAAVSEATCNSA
jgi:integration host factor subunit alpha